MTRTGNQTRPEPTNVQAFLAGIDDEQKRGDCEFLIQMMSRLTGETPVVWGSSMIGFGRYHYRYDSGHEGDSFLVGFSPRAKEFSIYLMGAYLPEDQAQGDELLAKLGKHRMGKACLYVRKLADIDTAVLEQLAQRSIVTLRQRYGRS